MAILSFSIIMVAGFLASRPKTASRIAERLERMGGDGPPGAGAFGIMALSWHKMSFSARVLRPSLQKAAVLAGRFTPKGAKEQVRRKLVMAGNPWGLQANEFIALKGLAFTVSAGTLFALGLGEGPGRAFLLGAVGGLFATILPELLLKHAVLERQRWVKKGLPDVLDLLTVSVEAGLGFDSALARVVEKARGPLAEEFERVLREIRVGRPRREALRGLSERTGVEDLAVFVAAIIQADQLGVSIGKVLRIQSAELRRKRRQRAEEAAMKAPIKMLFPLLLFVFPSLFVVLLGPALIQLLNTFRTMAGR
ncbi:MAG: type II secretion system F family protein [Firmicutes bacterium]|nr:type II secretion system F family protein [Bacillota bacterium]